MYESGPSVYLRCDKDHMNEVAMRDRDAAVGRPCRTCGSPLRARPDREEGPRRGGPRRY